METKYKVGLSTLWLSNTEAKHFNRPGALKALLTSDDTQTHFQV